MTTSVPLLTLLPFNGLPEATLDILREGITGLELPVGQKIFVGNPYEMVQLALADPARHPFVIVVSSATSPLLCGAQRWAPLATPWQASLRWTSSPPSRVGPSSSSR